jgi:fumarate hydratase subunit beta
MATYDLSIPISEDSVRALRVGDTVRLSGVMVTGRDAAHKYMVETFIRPSTGSGQCADAVPESERPLYEELRRLLREGVIYHCGPVVRQRPPSADKMASGPTSPPGGGALACVSPLREGRWEFVAAGPTTSIREEVYEPEVIAHFGLRGVIGKGGMGPGTLQACQEHGAVYFHAVGGAASLIADAVKEVVTVYKREEFGVPEAFWVIRVEGFPVVVTMDSHGRSIHDEVEAMSSQALERLIGGGR